MRIVRVEYNNSYFWGIYSDKGVELLKRDPFDSIEPGGVCVDFREVRLLAPAIASKVVLVGLNYKDHARELGMPLQSEPVIFLKPPSALIGHEDDIVYPRGVERLDYEAELAVVIKKDGKDIPEHKVPEYVLGYTCLNDVTARCIQKKDLQWSRAKSFDTFCPLGPWIETEAMPRGLTISSCLNDVIKQDSNTDQLVFSVPFLISFISQVMTLRAGDVISTGTPPGVGPMQAGDCIEVCIEGIGKLTNRVVF